MREKIEKKEEYIESEILCFFKEKWYKVAYKNDIKWYWNANKQIYQKNKSPFIRRWISDIEVYRNPYKIVIEVKKPSQMSFFTKSIEELNTLYAKAMYGWKSRKTIEKYRHAVEQRQYIDDVIAEWGIWFFACSLEQVKEKLKDIL